MEKIDLVRLGVPSKIDDYYMTDDPDMILHLHQKGFAPAWKDDSCLYFKLSNKLKKVLSEL